MADHFPYDVDPTIWTHAGANRFERRDGAAIYGIGRGQWEALVRWPDGDVRMVRTQRHSVRKFPSAGAAARFLALHHPTKGPSA